MVLLNDGEHLWRYANHYGLASVGNVLREYVLSGEPDTFIPGYTSRAMCRIASCGVENIKDEWLVQSYMQTQYGSALYFHMWGGDPLPEIR